MVIYFGDCLHLTNYFSGKTALDWTLVEPGYDQDSNIEIHIGDRPNVYLRRKMKEQIVVWLNRILVADVFLVLFGFIWFAVAVVGRYLNLPLGFDLWYRLWIPVFNPAIGILFLGAFATWAINKISRQLERE